MTEGAVIINNEELDNLVYEMMQDCSDVNPPLTRGEIAQIVMDHLRLNIRNYVFGSLKRLAAKGLLRDDSAASQNEPSHYWTPTAECDVTR
jgi:hypothetical protein